MKQKIKVKKELTPEQAAKRDERRAAFRKLVKRVADMSDVQKAELGRYGAVKLDGSSFGPCNTMLIALQSPGASMCASFGNWIKAGRCVRKGEHGVSIWVPIGGKKITNETTGATENESGSEKPGFTSGTVFDVSQTDALTERPVATVSPEIASAFGLASLPNVRVVTEQGELVAA